MDNVLGFLWEQLADARVMATLLAVLGFACRSQVTHWMNRDLEAVKAEHMRQLEEKKAAYQRDLEAYRTSLIAQTEAIKAVQEVRRSMAIAMTSKQVEAMHVLQAAFTGRCVQLFIAYRALPSMSRAVKEELITTWQQYIREMEAASRAVASFAGHDLQLCLSEILVEASRVLLELYAEQLPDRQPDDVNEFEARMFGLQMRFDSALREYVERIQAMRDL